MMQTETQIGWQDYLAIVIRRRWFFIVPCAVVIAVAMVVSCFLPKAYRAETILLVQEQQVMNPLIQGLAVSTSVGERLRTLREELLSWTSLSRLVHELDLDKRVRNPLVFERYIKQLQRDISVRMRAQDLITISYEDEDPKLAQKLVNTLTHIYMNRSVESQSAEAETAIKFIESEMAVYKKQLEQSERSLREFQELYVTQMPVATQLNEQIIDAQVLLAQLLVENTTEHPQVIQLKQRIEELKRTRNEEIKRVIASALAKGADPEIYQSISKALDAPLTQADAADSKIENAKKAYAAWVERLDNSTTTLNQAQAATPLQVISTSGPAQPGQASTPKVEVVGPSSPLLLSLAPHEQQELARLTRDYDVYHETYQQMQQRLERAKVTQRLGDSDEGTKFKVLEPARLPLKPVRPNRVKVFFFSMVLGIFIGAGVAFVAEYLDQSFQSAEELQVALELPVLGSISTILTEADLEERARRRRTWMSIKQNLQRVQTYVVQPIWARIDSLLVRWGL